MPGSPGTLPACLSPSFPSSLPPSLRGLFLLGSPRSSCSTRDESADVSWGFWSYRLALERRIYRKSPHAFLLLFAAHEWNGPKQFSKEVPKDLHTLSQSLSCTSFQIFITLLSLFLSSDIIKTFWRSKSADEQTCLYGTFPAFLSSDHQAITFFQHVRKAVSCPRSAVFLQDFHLLEEAASGTLKNLKFFLDIIVHTV